MESHCGSVASFSPVESKGDCVYTYMYMYMYICICIYIYLFIYRIRSSEMSRASRWGGEPLGVGCELGSCSI